MPTPPGLKMRQRVVGLLIFISLCGAACQRAPVTQAAAGRFTWVAPKFVPPDGCAVVAPHDGPTPGEEQGAVPASRPTAADRPAGWPARYQISEDQKPNFTGAIKPRALKAGVSIFRVIGSGGSPTGAYWAVEPPPATEAEWRTLNAVFAAWNGASCVERYIVPKHREVLVWEGRAGPQADKSRPGYFLRGGGVQLWIPDAPSQLNPALIQYSPVQWAR